MKVLRSRIFLRLAYCLCVSTCPSAGLAADTTNFAYIGTYTSRSSKGIYLSRFDPATGRLTAPELAIETRNPTFLALSPDNRFLYAVGEVGDFNGQHAGG